MADPIVHVTNGIPDAGTGNITTLGQTLLDGANFTLGSSTDLAVAAGAVGTISQKLRSISRDLVGGIVLQASSNTIGNVGQAGAPWSIAGTVGVSGTVTVTGTVAATQSGTWNIGNVSGTITLPTGAATAAKQPALGIAGTPSTDVLTVQGAASMTPLLVNGSAYTQPISGNVGITGTVNAAQSGAWNVGITGTVSVVQGGNFTTRIVGNTGNAVDFVSTQNIATPASAFLVGGEFNTVPTTILNGNSSPLQLDSSANLLVNVKATVLPPGAATSANQATAAAQGSTTAGQTGGLGMGAVTTSAPTYVTATSQPLSLDTSGNLRVVLSGGAGTGTSSNFGSAFPTAGTAVGVMNSAGTLMTYMQVNATNALKVDGSAVTQPVSGTFWQATQPVSGTVTANQGGAPWTMKPDGTSWALTGTSANVNVTNASVAVTGTFWQATQPISAASLPLPSGAATSANQPTAATLGSTTSGQTGNLSMGAVTTAAPTYTTATSNALSLTTAGALRVDGSAVTQPVSGTFWQATQPVSGTVTVTQTTAANLNATVVGTVTANQGGTWTTRIVGNAAGVLDFAGQNASAPANSLLVGAQFNTTPTTVLSGNVSPLQIDSAGNLKVNIMAGAGSGGTASSFGSAFPATGTAIGVMNSAGTAMTNLKTNASNALVVDGSGVTQPVSGTFWQTTQPVSGTFWQATQPVSAASLPLPAGAATAANQPTAATLGSTTSGQSGNLAMGAVTTSAPSYTTATTSALSLNTTGGLRVDGSGVTQPVSGNVGITGTVTVSGTVAATQSGTWNITNISGTVSLPTGAATSANQPSAAAIGSTTSGQTGNLAMGAVTTAAPSYTTATTNNLSLTTAGALRVDGSAVTQPVSGTFWQSTQPVSGTVTANQGGTWTVQPGNTANTTAWLVTGTGGIFPARITGNAGSTLDVSALRNVAGPSNMLVTGAQYNSATTSYTSGNFGPLQCDVNGNLLVNVAAGGGGGGGTSSNFGATFPTAGTAVGAQYLASPPTLTTGQMNGLLLTSTGKLVVDASQATVPVSGTGTFIVVQGTAANLLCTASQGGAPWTMNPGTPASWGIGTSTQNSAMVANGVMGLAQYNSSPTSITSGNMSPLQLDVSGNLKVNIQTGNTLSVSQGTIPWQVAGTLTPGSNPAGTGGVLAALVAATATPSATTAGQTVQALADKVGRQIVAGAIRTNKGKTVTTLTTTSSSAITPAGAAGVFNDLYGLVITNTSATSVTVLIGDGTGSVMTVAAPAGDTRGFTLPVDSAIPQATAATTWTAQLSAGVSSVSVTALWVANT